MELGLALTLIGLGSAFWVVALILWLIMKRKTRKCTASTSAIVIDYQRVIRDHQVYNHPIYEYDIDGRRYQQTGAALSHRTPSLNSSVLIMYDPHDPQRSYIQGYDNKVYHILMIAFMIVGSIPILICLGIALFA